MPKISENRALLFAALAMGFVALPTHAAEQQRPRLNLTMQPIDYPVEALAAAEEGTVLVELDIGIDGAVKDVVLQQSSGSSRLDDAGILAARGVKLSSPPMRGGVPVVARLPAEIIWKLPATLALKYMPADLPGAAAIETGDIVIGPRPIPGGRNVFASDYPSASLERDEMGTVILYALVRADGGVEDSRLAGTSGFRRLDEAALKIVRRFQYSPGKINGMPAPLWWVLTISFRLSDSKLGNCIAAPAITHYQKRERVASGDELPRYTRWTLVNAQGKIDESLLLTEKGWMSLDPALVAVMNQHANYRTRGRPESCWIYDGVDPMMDG